MTEASAKNRSGFDLRERMILTTSDHIAENGSDVCMIHESREHKMNNQCDNGFLSLLWRRSCALC